MFVNLPDEIIHKIVNKLDSIEIYYLTLTQSVLISVPYFDYYHNMVNYTLNTDHKHSYTLLNNNYIGLYDRLKIQQV